MQRGVVGVALAAVLAGCGDDETSGVSVRMDFEAPDFYAAPFPSDHEKNADGTVALGAFPNATNEPFVTRMVAVLDGVAGGFGLSSGIFFTASAPLDQASLPDLMGSTGEGASVFLVAVDPSSPDYLVRHPVDVRFSASGGAYGAANMVSLLPLQGMPLRPRTRYAAVVTTAVTSGGAPLSQTDAAAELFAGGAPAGLTGEALATYQAAAQALAAQGDRVAAFAAFTTADPVAEMATLVAAAAAEPVPSPTGLALTETFDDYCVYEGTVAMPVYQSGEPPYSEDGGGILFDGGAPVLDHEETARIVVTIPRAPSPAGGYPSLVLVRTGAGGDRPLVDRGVHGEAHGPALEEGSGPARDLAQVGFAGVSIDGPHGGLRNITGGDEQFLIFNFTNPVAMRDNIRQSALELALVPAILDDLTIDTADCAGSSASARFDGAHLALFGHSMGATIAPLTLAAQPRYGAAILSGAGGSWIENVIHKKSPVPVRPLADLLVGYLPGSGETLTEHDPVLTLLQWAGEPADPPLYAGALVREVAAGAAPRSVLMIQGIVDTYILPPIANATSLSIGLDLGGEPLDAADPELAQFTPLADLLPLGGADRAAYPIAGNRGDATAVVVQHREDGIEDGHEVIFQTEAPKEQYRCFLRTWLEGSPTVIEPGAPCD
jgi:hypothetical protein